MKIGIVGAGIVGRLLAWQMLHAGVEVHLFEEDAAGAKTTSYAAGGMLSPYAELEHSDLSIYQLGMRSLALWPEIIKSLIAPVYFQINGSLVVAHRHDKAELDRYINIINKKINFAPIKLLNKAALSEFESELINFEQAYYLPAEGQIDAQKLLDVLYQSLQKNAVNWEFARVNSVAAGEIKTVSKNFQFDWVFDCRGIGAKNDISGLRGIRGEIIWLSAPEVKLTRPIRLMHPRYRIYIVPKPNHIYLIGATEIESEDDSPITVRSALELLSAAYSVHTGFSEANIIKTLVRCRAAMPDHLPYIEEQDGLTRINGLYRHGFLLAPAVVEKVMTEKTHMRNYTCKKF